MQVKTRGKEKTAHKIEDQRALAVRAGSSEIYLLFCNLK